MYKLAHLINKYLLPLLWVLLVSNCARGPSICVTTCGMTITFISGTCAQLQATEDALLEELATHADWDVAPSCRALNGAFVDAHEPDNGEVRGWYSPLHRTRIGGQAYCSRYGFEPGIELVPPKVPGIWGTTTLTHEMVHLMEDCIDPWHKTWEERGLFLAIEEANGRDL